MDILDNIIYANLFSPLQPIPPGEAIISDYIPNLTPPAGTLPGNTGTATLPLFSYSLADKMDYCSYIDPIDIEKSIQRHWFDLNSQVNYDSGGVTAFNVPPNGTRFTSFENASTYHLIYAYFLENTRMLQIFERLLDRYFSDEEFGIADSSAVFNWIQNSEKLFFKNDTPRSSNIRSLIRPNSEATRRNAYWRMFGMDLAFGDINSGPGGSQDYIKARTSNQQFIILFERYLSEIWQGYINARNSSGANTADINVVIDLARQIREILIARRGNTTLNTYANLSLSREEFSSVLVSSWFAFIISDDTPVVNFLNCQSSTIGERLIKIGSKVGVPAHSKCQSLFEMAGAASTILTTIEVGGVLDNDTEVQNILSSLNPPVVPSVNANYMSDFLTIINNWEKATGHSIKTSPVNVAGTVRVQQPMPSRVPQPLPPTRVQQSLPTNGKQTVSSSN